MKIYHNVQITINKVDCFIYFFVTLPSKVCIFFIIHRVYKDFFPFFFTFSFRYASFSRTALSWKFQKVSFKSYLKKTPRSNRMCFFFIVTCWFSLHFPIYRLQCNLQMMLIFLFFEISEEKLCFFNISVFFYFF